MIDDVIFLFLKKLSVIAEAFFLVRCAVVLAQLPSCKQKSRGAEAPIETTSAFHVD